MGARQIDLLAAAARVLAGSGSQRADPAVRGWLEAERSERAGWRSRAVYPNVVSG